MSLTLSHVNNQFPSLQNQTLSSSDLLRLGEPGHFNPFRPQNPNSLSSPFFLGSTSNSNQEFNNNEDPNQAMMLQQIKPFHGMMQLSDLQNNGNSPFNLGFFSNNNNNGNANNETSTLFAGNMMNSQLYNSSTQNNQESVLPQMSATALLQKAAQMGVTTSNNNNANGSALLSGFPSSSSRNSFGENNNNLRSQMENETHLQDLMNSLAHGNASIFRQNLNDGLTRDFLGVGSMVRGMQGGMSHDMGSLDSESQSFSGGNLQ